MPDTIFSEPTLFVFTVVSLSNSPNPKAIQFLITEAKEKKQILTGQKLEREKFAILA